MSVITDFVIEEGVLKKYQGTDGNVVIPNGVTSIERRAFYKCKSLRSITIPNSVTSIGEYAFYDCGKLTGTYISYGVTSIESRAFYKCNSLRSITIPNSVTSIGDHAFCGCESLTSVTIPSSVTSIGKKAFLECGKLERVDISDIAAWCNISFDDEFANPLSRAHNLYLNGELMTDLVIPEGVTKICKYAFFFCESLASITIPDSVTSIDCGAFSGCRSLTSITIPNSVTRIGTCAFYDCRSLTSVTIPDSVTSIGWDAFAPLCGTRLEIISYSSTVKSFEELTSDIYKGDIVLDLRNVPFISIKNRKRKDLSILRYMENRSNGVEYPQEVVKKNDAYIKRYGIKNAEILLNNAAIAQYFIDQRLLSLQDAMELLEESADKTSVEVKTILMEYIHSFRDEEREKFARNMGNELSFD